MNIVPTKDDIYFYFSNCFQAIFIVTLNVEWKIWNSHVVTTTTRNHCIDTKLHAAFIQYFKASTCVAGSVRDSTEIMLPDGIKCIETNQYSGYTISFDYCTLCQWWFYKCIKERIFCNMITWISDTNVNKFSSHAVSDLRNTICYFLIFYLFALTVLPDRNRCRLFLKNVNRKLHLLIKVIMHLFKHIPQI